MATSKTNAAIMKAHEERWEVCLRRSEVVVRQVRSVVVAAWDQLGKSIQESIQKRRSYGQAVREIDGIVRPIFPTLTAIFASFRSVEYGRFFLD